MRLQWHSRQRHEPLLAEWRNSESPRSEKPTEESCREIEVNRTIMALALTAGLGASTLVSPAGAADADIAASADTYVDKTARSTNYGSSTRLLLDGRKALRKHALIKVAIPTVPAGETVESISLRLRPTTSSSRGVVVHRTGSAWSEDKVTWRTMPTKHTRLGSSDALVAGTEEAIDLDPSKVTPGTVVGLRLETSATRRIAFRSSEAASGRPSVRIVTSGSVGDATSPDPEPTPHPEPSRNPDQAFPPVAPVSPKLIGMSAPAKLWDQRVREVGQDGITARRIFANLSSSGGNQMSLIRRALADDMMPVISYKVPNVQTMIDGGYDAWLAELRRQLTSLDGNVTATFWHEPHGDMDPAQFRAASLKFLKAVDAPSIAVGPILNGWLLDRRVADFAAYTDAELLKKWEFVAVDSYQSGEPGAPGSSMPARAIPLLADWMDSVGHPNKPLGLGEYNGFSASAIAGAGQVLLSTPELWFGLAWNSQGDSYAPLSGDRLAAFQDTKADERAAR